MADPFDAVAESYDVMVDWPTRLAREKPFFEKLLHEQPVYRALDVGCGTGHHSRLFAEMGATVIGIDPSEQMVQHARSLTTTPNPSFMVGDFDDIATLPGDFDLVVALGNTLAFVEGNRQLVQMLNDTHDKLSAGGRICIQVINYDRVLREGVHRLPLVHRQRDNREYLFLREYRTIDDKVEFTISMLIRDGEWRQGIERAEHYPLTQRALEEGLQRAGFTNFNFYGDFQRTPYDPVTSPGLVVLAKL
ncbi:MAG TPA: class I SAM-dependent methyltransferase [Armatimonadota bacterium]|nr:class I SAM-dependent methyltransferase [Armatimonadota bacterium]